MKTVGAYEAKTHLSQLLESVIKGEQITIIKHGVPIALLSPINKHQPRETHMVIEELKEFRQKHSLNGLSIRDMIEEGRS